MGTNYVVTFARGFGSGGKQVALKLAESLGIQCYENRLLAYASLQLGVGEGEIADVDERLHGSYITKQLERLQRSILPLPVTARFVSDDQLFACQSEIIRRLCDEGPCVIVGKCADYVLRDRENVIRIYIEAPREFCRSRIMRRMDVSEEEADHLIEKTDKYRADYYKYYTGGNDWRSPVNYDMTLNSGLVGVENCVTLIRDYMKLKLPDIGL